MYDEKWWLDYKDWEKETRASHQELAGMIDNMEGYHPEARSEKVLLDFGCGRLHLASSLFDFDYYIGIDLNPEPFYKADIFQEKFIYDAIDGVFRKTEKYKKVLVKYDYTKFPWEEIADRAKNIEVIMTSLFSTEMYLENPNEIYKNAFLKGKVDKIIASGARYPDTKLNIPFQEEGSKIYQTDPCCPSFTSWTEKRINSHVPSKMFGENVIEVWRIMEK